MAENVYDYLIYVHFFFLPAAAGQRFTGSLLETKKGLSDGIPHHCTESNERLELRREFLNSLGV